MNTVPGIGERIVTDKGRGQQTVGRQIDVGKFTCQAAHDLDLRGKILTEEELVLNRNEEGLHDHDLGTRLFLNGSQHSAIALLKDLIRDPASVAGMVPDIVDADQDGYDIRLDVYKIRLQTVDQVNGLVAGNAQVNKFKFDFGMVGCDDGCGIFGIAGAQIVTCPSLVFRVS